jgi:NUMOD3 motif
MLLLEPLARYDLSCTAEVYTLDLSNGQYLCSRYSMKINKTGLASPLVRKQTEETKLKISKANKGKRLGCAPWNKGKKLHYIPGKREHSEQTLQKMSEAAKRRWSSMYNNNI